MSFQREQVAKGPILLLHLTITNDSSPVEYNESRTSEVPIYYSFPSRYSDGYKNELNHFLDVVQAGAAMSVTDR